MLELRGWGWERELRFPELSRNAHWGRLRRDVFHEAPLRAGRLLLSGSGILSCREARAKSHKLSVLGLDKSYRRTLRTLSSTR